MHYTIVRQYIFRSVIFNAIDKFKELGKGPNSVSGDTCLFFRDLDTARNIN